MSSLRKLLVAVYLPRYQPFYSLALAYQKACTKKEDAKDELLLNFRDADDFRKRTPRLSRAYTAARLNDGLELSGSEKGGVIELEGCLIRHKFGLRL